MIARVRDEIRRRIDWGNVGAVVAGLLVGVLIFLVLWWKHDGDARDRLRQQQINGLSKALDKQRDQVRKLGQQPIAPPASKVRENPNQPIPSPSATPVGPTQAQVDAAVADYCGQPSKPCQGPAASVAQIAAAAVNYLRQHPAPAGPKGDTGPPPTADQLGTAVADYCGRDSKPCQGPKGDPGPAGPGPTSDQLAAAVRDYVADHPLPTCPDGTSATAETVLTTKGPVDAVICVRS